MKHVFDNDGICKGCGMDGVEEEWQRMIACFETPMKSVTNEECPAAIHETVGGPE